MRTFLNLFQLDWMINKSCVDAFENHFVDMHCKWMNIPDMGWCTYIFVNGLCRHWMIILDCKMRERIKMLEIHFIVIDVLCTLGLIRCTHLEIRIL